MANLAPLSDLGTSPRGREALGVLLQESPHLRFMEQNSAFELDATDFQVKPEDSTTNGQGRALGGSYNAANMVPGSPEAAALAFFGDAFDVDISHVADGNRGLRNVDVYLAKRWLAKFRAWARRYELKSFQGDPGVTATDMTGYRTLLDGTVLTGFTSFTGFHSAADDAGGANKSLDLSTDANDDLFIEAFDSWLAKVRDPRGVEVSPKLHARMTTIARRAHILGESRDLFGRPVSTFNGVPFVRLNPETITADEPNSDASATDTTSLYIQSPGEMKSSLVTNSGLYFRDRGELEGEQAERVVWEFRGQNKVEEKDAILRVAHIKL